MGLDTIFQSRAPSTTVYVSCNPETLGGDLRIIVAHGYTVHSVQPLNMFPHTHTTPLESEGDPVDLTVVVLGHRAPMPDASVLQTYGGQFERDCAVVIAGE